MTSTDGTVSIREEISQFINQFYCDYLRKKHNFNTSEPDEFTDSSVYIAAYIDGVIVGSIRLILGADNQITQYMPELGTTVPEASRLIVAPDYRGDHIVTLSLFHEICIIALEYQHKSLVSAVNLPVLKLLTALGFKLTKFHDEPKVAYAQSQYVIGVNSREVVNLTRKLIVGVNHVTLKRFYPDKLHTRLEIAQWQ